MKKIVVFVVLSMLLFACSKSEDSYQEPISWKTGIFTSQITKQSSLMITFAHSSELIEFVRFQSEWTISTRDKTYTLNLKESDFIWANEDRKLEGIYTVPLQVGDYQRASVRYLHGEVRINGKWKRMTF
jgi:lipoprotein